MSTTPQHMFHGYAAGFGARFEKPFVHQAAEAVTALAPVGGRASAVSRNYQLKDLFTFDEATSSVLGHYYTAKAPVDVTAETRVSASVKGLVVPGVLTADRISMALVSERDFPQKPRRFRIEEARIEGLKIRGVGTIEFDFSNIDLGDLKKLRNGGATQDDLEPFRRDTPDAIFAMNKESRLARVGDASVLCPPIFEVTKGTLTFKIHLLELLIRHGSMDLSMLRIEVHTNPREGSFAAASGGVNGNPST